MSEAAVAKRQAKASGGLDFNIIGGAVAAQFARMAKAGQLYRTVVQGEGDDEARRGLTD